MGIIARRKFYFS